jgi:effector-binding domain-containing protein
MIDPPRIVQTEPVMAAVIHVTAPRAEIQHFMGPAIAEVMAAVAAQHIGPAGPVFAHHLRMDAHTFDFEVGVPVAAPVHSVGRVRAGSLPATRAVRTVYHGAYAGLGAAWGEFEAWIAANGHVSAADFWECYLKGPESSPLAREWCTEFTRPIA